MQKLNSAKPIYLNSFILYMAVGLVAIALRLAYGWLAYEQNFFPDLFLDSQHYVGIAAGRGSGDTAYVMSPLYPYFLSLFIVDGEFTVWWVRIVQMLAGVLSCLMIAALARHYGGMNFWIGNHKDATGLFNTPSGTLPASIPVKPLAN